MTDPVAIDVKLAGYNYALADPVTRLTIFNQAMDAVEALQKRVPIGGLTCACRFRGVEGAIRHGSDTGELVDPDEPIHECALHAALRKRVAATQLEVEQCHAKSTCCCGSYMKQHSAYDGHTPVAMYDYAFDRANTRAEAAEAREADLAGVLEVCRVLNHSHKEREHCALCRRIKTVLAATPAEALERVKAWAECERICRIEKKGVKEGIHHSRCTWWALVDVLDKLDVLDSPKLEDTS